jgi:hypothetical protein
MQDQNQVDVLPFILGNPELKEVLLYAMCRYDEKNPKLTTPLIIIGRSGEGKTAVLENIGSIYPSKMFQKDGITEASLHDLKMSRMILCIDELSKWSINCLGAVVMLFSHGKTERARKGGQTKIVANGLPVGTLLDTWENTVEDFKGIESKRFIIAQLLRRAIVLHAQPTTRDPVIHRQYIESVVSDIFGLDDRSGIKIATIKKNINTILLRAQKINYDIPDIPKAERDSIIDYMMKFQGKIEMDSLVSYDEEFPKLLSNLAVGRALSYGRRVVELADYQRVGTIIEVHAKELGLWRERKTYPKGETTNDEPKGENKEDKTEVP